jgi:3-mercaptopyruvate sulfurtransferase SseA
MTEAGGVSQRSRVVVYDDGDATAAARGWWLLRYHGHQDVRVLDGGCLAWLAAGHPVTTAEPACQPGDFTARCWPSRWPASRPRSTRAHGPTGSPTRRAPWRRAADLVRPG